MIHRVLVVEDDIEMQGYCKTILEAEAFLVDACSTAADARRLFQENRPDLVVLDHGLPDGNGLDLMREWHSQPGPKVAVIFLTGRSDLKTRLECFQQGAQDYLCKPFAAEELVARVKVQLKVKKSHEELVRRNYELELVARARQDMTDMIVHDLKAPLTAIMGTLELIHSRGLISQENYSRLVQNAGTAADFMLLMLNDVLDVAQAQEKGLVAEIGTIDLAALLSKLEVLFESRLRLTGVTLATVIAPGVTVVRADQNLLYRILTNLIANALNASPKGAVVEIECGFEGSAARLTVSDRGRGIRDAEKKTIFEPFVAEDRKDPSMDAGTGIGLSFCHVAVVAHKGRIWVEDRPGGGSRFIVELPQAS